MTEAPGALYVVESERQAERLAREGLAAKTRSALVRAIVAAFAPDVILAPPEATRLALDLALARIAPEDVLLGPIMRAGGLAWARTVDAMDARIGAIRAAGENEAALADVAKGQGAAASRARTIRGAVLALDAELAKAGLLDARAAPRAAARAIRGAKAEDVARAVGSSRVVARGVIGWDGSDVAFWRALDGALAKRGGSARIELGVFEARLDPSRERGPLELVADELARALDDTPLLVPIAARLGDLRFEGAAPTSAVEVRRAANAEAQARAAADAVHAALASGTPLDRIAVALPRLDDEVIWPLRAALDTAGIVAHEPRGRAPMRAGIVAVALEALAIGARGLPRRDVARLLSSRYLDAQALTGESERRAAVALLLDLARALEETPTARDADARAALVATARAFRAAGDDRVEARASLASRVAEILAAPNLARTHAAHVAAARALFAALGLAPRMGAGARTALADDARPEGIARAELAALAEDAHAWDVLAGALDSYDAAARRLGVADAPSAGESFRHHVTRVLEVGAPPLGAARAGAVRIARLADLAGEDLALLVVVDANDGILPGAPSSDPLLPEELARALGAAPAPLRRARELASLALAAAGAERVVLTYRLRDEQGGAMAPAPLAAWLERAGAPTTTFRASPLAERPLSLADARLGWLARAPEHAASLAPEAARRASIERRREEFFYDAARAADDRTGRIAPSAELARALADDTGAARPLAITSLESAARCPFQGFASIVLRARDPSIRGELPDAREQGSIVHEALAAAFRATAALWPARPRDANAIEERALAAAESVLARELVGSPLRDVVLARARDDVRAVLAFSLADIEWDFALAEQAFGEGGPWAPLRLEAAGAPLLLRGKIDRVDLAHEAPFTRAIDYKSSRRAADAGTREMGTTAFQVPLYALVAARATGKASARGLYLPTPARDLEGGVREVDAERWAGLLARVPDAAAEIIGRIREGALAPVPHDERACIFCHVRGGCRKPRFAVAVQDGDLGDSRAT